MMKESVKQPTCIVVDDDRNTVSVFTEFLELEGVKILGAAYDGLDAVNLYKQLMPDIVFLDVMMPEHDGIFALEQIRKINPDAIVIMVTADLRAETEKILSQLKASAIVYKPYDVDNLISLVNRLYSTQKVETKPVSEPIQVGVIAS